MTPPPLRPPHIKAVFFDLDDTLWPMAPVVAHAELLLYEWLHRNVPELTRQLSLEDLGALRHSLLKAHPAYHIDLHQLLLATLERAFTQTCANTCHIAKAVEIYTLARDDVSLFEDALPCLNALKPHYTLASISNGYANLDQIGLSAYFKHAFSARQCGFAKPDPRIYSLACQTLGLAPHEVLHVGDDLLQDVAAAQHAGCKAAWIRRKGQARKRKIHPEIHPDIICSDLHKLTNLLNCWHKQD